MATRPVPTLDPVTADDRPAMDGWFALQERARAHDLPLRPRPCRRQHAARFSWPGSTLLVWAVHEGSEVVGIAELALPQRDGVDNAFAYVLVAPVRRRRGLGTRLLDHLAVQARAAGRARLVTWAMEPLDGPGPGSAFLRAAGARLGQTEIVRRLAVDPAVRPAASARQAAAGYALVQWTGPTPEAWLDDIAVLTGRMSTDAPTGELTQEPERWDAERVREHDAATAASGARPVVTAARGPDGHLAAFTVAFTCVERHGYADQGDTLVVPAHRGRRLGLWTKLANLDLLRAEHPEVRMIDTYNAAENRYMVAINDALGFAPLYRQGDWELDLAVQDPTGPDPTGPDPCDGQAGTTAPISAAASGP